MKTLITFRLRKDLDSDLIAANVDGVKLQDICRDGLRLMLGIRTTKQVEVKEKKIVLPPEQTVRTIPGKPAVYIPNQRR
jgi:hypothetical protein